MTEDRIERALEDDFLAPDSSPSRRAAYIRRTMDKARRRLERQTSSFVIAFVVLPCFLPSLTAFSAQVVGYPAG
jgi:hypothetical protein